MNTENVSTFKIHKLSQEQYDRERDAGNLEETALYLTPDNEADFIVEQGIKDGWIYRKWDSGIGECWATLKPENSVEPGRMTFYIPIHFVEWPVCMVAPMDYEASNVATTTYVRFMMENEAMAYYDKCDIQLNNAFIGAGGSANQGDGSFYNVSIQIIGKWK